MHDSESDLVADEEGEEEASHAKLCVTCGEEGLDGWYGQGKFANLWYCGACWEPKARVEADHEAVRDYAKVEHSSTFTWFDQAYGKGSQEAGQNYSRTVPMPPGGGARIDAYVDDLMYEHVVSWGVAKFEK